MSVSMPPSSASAASLGISAPAASMTSLTISQQDARDSSQRTTPAPPHLPVGVWWSMTTSALNPSGARICSGDDVSTTTFMSKPSPYPSRTAVSSFVAAILATLSRPSGAKTAHPGKHLAMAYADPNASMSALPWTITALVRPSESAFTTSSRIIFSP